MRRPDLPLPSFTLVMSRAANFDVSRLPPYRASYIERFHPYARVSPRRPQDTLMTTVDHRYREEAVGEEPAPHARAPARREETHDDTSTYEEHSLAVGVDADDREAPSGEERFKLGRSKVAGALTELLETLRSTYVTVQVVRSFLAPGQTK